MTSNWQNWVVALLLLLCIWRIGVGILSSFRLIKKHKSPCDNCPSGCDLKRQLDEKSKECAQKQKNAEKKCCG